ncbi:hypothetical protein PROFUN_01043 [Planoprotostelium fungivorum]|uniref:Uncharacterized protein n=1 Tax=Planoprotostelium fungivorum TaxID=1890364 RepID=A0A2P6N4H6_9EUKA|nr:hypothetical protein PROFUN_01043 [Planoprotostelium fungivorum]
MHITGASPTTYYLWKEAMDIKLSGCDVSSEYEAAMEAQQEASSYNDLHACSFTDTDVVELASIIETATTAMINQKDHNGNTPLIWAASEGRFDIAEALIDQGCNINAQNYNGETALFLAAGRGHIQMVDLLLLNTANPNICDLNGASPMHMAASIGRSDILKVFNRYSAYMTVTDDFGDSLLHYTVRGGHMEALKYLVNRAGLSVDIINEDEETPMDLATALGEDAMMEFLSSAPGLIALQRLWSRFGFMFGRKELPHGLSVSYNKSLNSLTMNTPTVSITAAEGEEVQQGSTVGSQAEEYLGREGSRRDLLRRESEAISREKAEEAARKKQKEEQERREQKEIDDSAELDNISSIEPGCSYSNLSAKTFDSFHKITSITRDFHTDKLWATPELLLVGAHRSGKTTCLEILLGHSLDMETKRPIHFLFTNNPEAAQPKITVKRDILDADGHDVTTDITQLGSHIRKRNMLTEVPLSIRYEWCNTFDFTVIDLPGLYEVREL